MGVICNEERKEVKRNKIIKNSEIDIMSNGNKETEDSIQNLKNDIKKEEEEEKSIISKINEKFNIINKTSSNNILISFIKKLHLNFKKKMNLL